MIHELVQTGPLTGHRGLNDFSSGMRLAMTLIETSRRLGRAERKVLRLQGRLWLAQLAMWPTAIVFSAVLVAGAVWVLRRRSAGHRPEPAPRSIDPAGDQAP